MNVKQFENTLSHFIFKSIMVKIKKKLPLINFSLNVTAERST